MNGSEVSRTVITGFARTPFGRFGGALKGIPAVELGAMAAREALARAHVAPEDVSETYFGSAVLAASTLVAARQCAKRLWLEVHRPELRQDSAASQAIFAAVNDVGAVARHVYDPHAQGDLDVPDPYYGGRDGFDACLELVEAACPGLLTAVRNALDERGVGAA